MTNKLAVKLLGILLPIFCLFLSVVNAAPGDLDTTFAGTGFVREASGQGSYDIIFATALQPDGKIVSVGWHTYGDILGCGVGQVSQSLPPDRRLGVEQPIDHAHRGSVTVRPAGRTPSAPGSANLYLSAQ